MRISLTLRTYLHVFHLLILGSEGVTTEDAAEDSVKINLRAKNLSQTKTEDSHLILHSHVLILLLPLS